jgi:NAD(P)-dependent dehydrogenase (short-subunit alcohol dehydrogenase family)
MPNPPRPISSQVIAVTGGARGIGRATAAALVREGGHVAIGDLDLEAAEATAAELGPLVSAHRVDVTDHASFAAFLDEVEQRFDALDVLVNNAGIMVIGPFVEEADEVARRQIDINLHGVIFGMKEAIPRMLPRGRGHVINIASAAGKVGYPGGATYCATKHAVVGLSEAVGAELKKTPLEVSAVCPAVVNTELASGLSPTRGVKLSEPEDVAAAIVATIQRPRAEVFVPRSVGVIGRAIAVLPRPAREAVIRALRGDRVLADIDEAQRAAYRERVSSSPAPAADGGPTDHLPRRPEAEEPPAGGDPVAATSERRR